MRSRTDDSLPQSTGRKTLMNLFHLVQNNPFVGSYYFQFIIVVKTKMLYGFPLPICQNCAIGTRNGINQVFQDDFERHVSSPCVKLVYKANGTMTRGYDKQR